MADKQLLDYYLKESGKKKVYLAEKLNVSRPRLNYILENPETATVGQADILSKELHILSDKKSIIFLP